MSFNYAGYMNQADLKKALGFGGKVNPISLKSGLREFFTTGISVRELQQFVRRYEWKNLPEGLDATLMERILYFRGRIMIFKNLDGKFYSLPFALNGSIDIYGRYNSVTPLTFNGSIATDEDGGQYQTDGEYLSGKQFRVLYDEYMAQQYKPESSAVIINDYTQGISEYIIPRYQLNLVYHKELANIIVLVRHNLVSSARVYSVRVLDQGQADSVREEYEDMESQILDEGKRIFTVTSSSELKEFLTDKKLETQEYWECFVSLDNLRENLIGIENNGVFKKKERQLKGEQELEASSADLVYEDGLFNRQQAAKRINALFGTNIEVCMSPTIQGTEEIVDTNEDKGGDEDEIY